jgi:HEAT repeat protein
MDNVLRRFLVSAVALGVAVVSSSSAADQRTHGGRAEVYKNLQSGSLEAVSSPQTIRHLFGTNGRPVRAPTKIWQVLEHGEKVECLSCIPLVATLLYNEHPKTREISAWWLRRRVFGVFGPGEVYSQVVAALGDPNATEVRRVHAAGALGEFLSLSGAKYLGAAIRNDTSPLVREAAVNALVRMNSAGPNGEISVAMADAEWSVRLAAVRAATRVNAFADVASVVLRVGDASAEVRRAAALSIGTMRAVDAVDGLIALVSPAGEADAAVRKAAVWSLGQIADPSAEEAVRAALRDPDPLVRDAARVALRRM